MFGSGVRAMRCTFCSIQYPPAVTRCPICENKYLWAIYKSGPDPDWRERVRDSLGLDPQVPTIAYTSPHQADLEIPLHVWDGRMWLSHDELTKAGYVNLSEDSIVFVGNRFYELQGRRKRGGDMWWVEEVVVDGCFDDVTPEQIINGGEDV